MKLNQKFTKSVVRRHSIQHERKVPLKEFGGGGRALPQGDVFSGTYGTTFVNGILYHKQLILYSHQTVWLPTLVAITTQHEGTEVPPNFWYFYVNNVS